MSTQLLEKPKKKARKRAKREKVPGDRGLYRRNDVDGVYIYYACATPAGEKVPVWKTIGRVTKSKACEERDKHRDKVRGTPLGDIEKRNATWDDVADLALAELAERIEDETITEKSVTVYRYAIDLHGRPF